MNCSCKDLEKEFGNGACKCIHYRKLFPECECERTSVSDHSPGTVVDHEMLIRTVYSPHQYNKETDELTPMAFRDAVERGMSVNRRSCISIVALQAKIEGKVAADQAAGRTSDGFWRVVVAKCGSIRRLRTDEGARTYAVYDTANEDDSSHADICQAYDPPPETPHKQALKQKIRSQVASQFSVAMDLSSAYSAH